MLADLVGSIRVEAVSAAQLLDQLTTKLSLLSLFSSSDLKLSQAITSATNHQVVKPHALPAATEGIERLTNRGGLGDRMTWVASRHPASVAPGTALLAKLSMRTPLSSSAPVASNWSTTSVVAQASPMSQPNKAELLRVQELFPGLAEDLMSAQRRRGDVRSRSQRAVHPTSCNAECVGLERSEILDLARAIWEIDDLWIPREEG